MRALFVFAACCAGLLASACKKKETPPPPAQAAAASLDADALATAGRGREAQGALPRVLDQPAVLVKLADGGGATGDGGDGREFIFAERGGGVAWMEGVDGGYRVFHNGRGGGTYAAIGKIVLSPDGRRCAFAAQRDGKWRMVVDGAEGEGYGEVDAPAFSPDGAHLAYRAQVGERWHLVVDGRANGGTATRYAMHAFAAGSSRLVFVDDADDEGCGRLVVSDLAFQKQTVIEPRASAPILSSDGSRVAAIAVAGDGQRVLSASLDRPDAVARGPVQEAIHNLAFSPDGRALAYVARRAGAMRIVLGDREETIPGSDVIVTAPSVRPDASGVGAAVMSSGAVFLREYLLGGARGEGGYENIDDIVYTGDARFRAYAAKRGREYFVVVNGKEGPAFDRVVSPIFSPDGQYLVYRARKDGKRFVVVADTTGKTILQHPAYEQVFPVKFTADGRSVAYGVKDGRQLAWKVEPLP